MNSPPNLIDEIRRRGGTLFLDGAELKYRGPQDVMTDESREQLRTSKMELKKILSAEAVQRERPIYPDQNGLVKCYYCEHMELETFHQGFGGTRAKCMIDGQHKTGIALLIKCPNFVMQTVH